MSTAPQYQPLLIIQTSLHQNVIKDHADCFKVANGKKLLNPNLQSWSKAFVSRSIY